MRRRAIRSQIYLPTVRFGVRDSDWKYVFLLTMTGYVLPFLLEVRVFRVPLSLPACLLTLGLSVAFLNWTRLGRKPQWLEHQLRALVEQPNWPRRLPCDQRCGQFYLIDEFVPEIADKTN